MAELHNQESEFSRFLRQMPFDDAPRPEQANHLREQVLARFDQMHRAASATPWWLRAFREGKDFMRRSIPRLIAMSAIGAAIFGIWMLVPGPQSTARAFNRFADALVQARTARFDMEVAVEGQPKQKFKAMYLAPDKFRQELGMIVNISDFSAGKLMTLMPAQKKAMVLNIIGVPKQKMSENHFDRLRELLAGARNAKDDQYQHLGKKEIDGKEALGFRLDTPAATTTLWGDPKTGQPVRIETVWSGIPRTDVAMTNFEINVDLQASLFDMTPPAGYKVDSIDVEGSEPREPDLVAAFKVCAEIGSGEFPESLDTASVTQLVTKHIVSHMKDITDAKMQQLMKDSIKIGRGFQFALMLPESAEATYAGKDVKRDTKDRPIFWYKPDGSKTYRVLYADLMLHDAETAPQVAGAKRIEKASKASRVP